MPIKFATELETVVIIDASYLAHFCIFSAYSTFEKTFGAPKDIHNYDFSQDAEYIGFFKQRVTNLVSSIRNKYFVKNEIIFCSDCKRTSIWRKEFFPDYKIDREVKDETKPNFGTIFRYYNSQLIPSLIEDYGYKWLKHPRSEGDDIIAILKKHIRSTLPNTHIVIIANDRDFLQLYDNKTNIFNLFGEEINKNSTGCPKKDLLVKILMGDKGDCIPAIKDRLGQGTALKLVENTEKLKILLSDKEILEKFKHNKRLIDFKEIPEIIQQEVIELYNA